MKKKIIVASMIVVCLSMLFVACGKTQNTTVTPDNETKTTTLDAPVLTSDGKEVRWDVIDSATSYEVFVNGQSVSNQTETNYLLNETTAGTYSVYVIAKGNGNNILDSKASDVIEIIISPAVLSIPVLNKDGKTVSWNRIENSVGYEVYVNDVLRITTSECSYTLTDTQVGSYTIKVKAVGDGVGFINSGLSDEEAIVIEPTELVAPVLVKDGNTITWNAVENAESYEVYVDNVFVTSINELTYTIADTGKYTVQIKATTTNSQYVSSALSDEVIIHNVDLTQPLIIRDGYFNKLLKTDESTGKLQVGNVYSTDVSGAEAYMLVRVEECGEDAYRIKTQRGTYLTLLWYIYDVRTDGLGQADYVYEKELDTSDLCQVWKLVADADVENGYRIRNFGRGLEFELVVSTTYTDGITLWHQDLGSVFLVDNVSADFESDKTLNDISGKYYFANRGTGVYYTLQDNVLTRSDITEGTLNKNCAWTLEKVSESGANHYRIRMFDGRYVTMVPNVNPSQGYVLTAAEFDADNDAQIFIFNSVAGRENCYKIANKQRGSYVDASGLVRNFIFSDNTYIADYWSLDNNALVLWNLSVVLPAESTLEAPVIAWTDNVINWTAVDNAEYYEVYVNGVSDATLTDTNYTFSKTEAGDYSIVVFACTNNSAYDNSEASNVLSKNISIFEKPVLMRLSSANKVVGIDPSVNYLTFRGDYSQSSDFSGFALQFIHVEGMASNFYRIKTQSGHYLEWKQNARICDDGVDDFVYATPLNIYNNSQIWFVEEVSGLTNTYYIYNFNHAADETTYYALCEPLADNIHFWYNLQDARFQWVLTQEADAEFASDSTEYPAAAEIDLSKPSVVYLAGRNRLLTFASDDANMTFTTETYKSIADKSAYAMTFEKKGDYYAIKLANGNYLYADDTIVKQGAFVEDNNAYLWELHSEGGNMYTISNLSVSDKILCIAADLTTASFYPDIGVTDERFYIENL